MLFNSTIHLSGSYSGDPVFSNFHLRITSKALSFFFFFKKKKKKKNQQQHKKTQKTNLGTEKKDPTEIIVKPI